MKRVMLVEPYYAGSHKAWADGVSASSKHEIDLLTLPGRFWKWRMFGGSLTLGRDARDRPRPDVILVSDMVDLPSFLSHAQLDDVPTVLYMHENQLTYPLSPTARDDLAYAYMNWSSMVRADRIWFNSRFHLESVFEALPAFLRHFPDVRHTGLIDDVAGKASVIPVGVDLQWVEPKEKVEPPLVTWSQRWEYDKDPVRLFNALYRLVESGADFQLAICGENFRNVPEEFDDAKRRLAEQIVHFGYAQTHRYEEILLESSVVVSTAKHEFFGITAVEAMAAGAVPVFPDDLSYPELIPEKAHEHTLYGSDDELDFLLYQAVTNADHRKRLRKTIAPAMKHFGWSEMAKKYDNGLASVASGR